jgi:lipopolysaccharide/colanic/teichoic acid biosynthesis glycosyltransferase
MDIATRVQYKEKIALITGDALVIGLSLWLTYVLRNLSFPTYVEFVNFIYVFAYLIPIWFVLFFIGGLYDGQTLVTKKKIPKTIAVVQSINIVLTVIYFYAFASYGDVAATPKTILILYALFSIALLFFWRLYMYRYVAYGKRVKALLVGSGKEMEELMHEVNRNSRYPFIFEKSIDLDTVTHIPTTEFGDCDVIVVDSNHPKASTIIAPLYTQLFLKKGKNYIDFVDLYEDIFKRVPLSSLDHEWFLRNISMSEKKVYDFVKRTMDIVLSLILAVPFIILYPFTVLAIWLEDRGSPFILQDRVGERGRAIIVKKFRTMTGNQNGVWIGEKSPLKITRVGSFLRKSRIDELPQILSIIKGDSSLIGPRADLTGLRTRLVEEIPYYEARYIVKPGLSGWAQVTQEGLPPQSVDETKLRLSYDFYYIKHRSIWLDVIIAFKTIKTLSMRVGV